MYAIYAYIDPSNHPNVGIYGIHGVSGIYNTKQNRLEQLKLLRHCFTQIECSEIMTT